MSDVQTVKRTIIKHHDHVDFFSDGTINIKDVRASYPHLDKPWAGPPGQPSQGEPRFHIMGLIPKTPDYKPSVLMIRDYVNELLRDAKIPAIAPDRKFLRDGDQRPDKPEMVGNYTVSASELRPPSLRGKRRDARTNKLEVITPEQAARVFYGGCWINLLIRPWVQNNQFGKRVNANLLAVQFVRDDEAFGQGRISDDAIDESFGPIDDDDSGYDDGLGDDGDFDL